MALALNGFSKRYYASYMYMYMYMYIKCVTDVFTRRRTHTCRYHSDHTTN